MGCLTSASRGTIYDAREQLRVGGDDATFLLLQCLVGCVMAGPLGGDEPKRLRKRAKLPQWGDGNEFASTTEAEAEAMMSTQLRML